MEVQEQQAGPLSSLFSCMQDELGLSGEDLAVEALLAAAVPHPEEQEPCTDAATASLWDSTWGGGAAPAAGDTCSSTWRAPVGWERMSPPSSGGGGGEHCVPASWGSPPPALLPDAFGDSLAFDGFCFEPAEQQPDELGDPAICGSGPALDPRLVAALTGDPLTYSSTRAAGGVWGEEAGWPAAGEQWVPSSDLETWAQAGLSWAKAVATEEPWPAAAAEQQQWAPAPQQQQEAADALLEETCMPSWASLESLPGTPPPAPAGKQRKRSGSPHPAGGGKQAGAGKVKDKPCSYFLEGSCRRANCRFAHDLSLITCRFWEAGACFKGDLCPFLHGYPAPGSLETVVATNKPSKSRANKAKALRSRSESPLTTAAAAAVVVEKKKPRKKKFKVKSYEEEFPTLGLSPLADGMSASPLNFKKIASCVV